MFYIACLTLQSKVGHIVFTSAYLMSNTKFSKLVAISVTILGYLVTLSLDLVLINLFGFLDTKKPRKRYLIYNFGGKKITILCSFQCIGSHLDAILKITTF